MISVQLQLHILPRRVLHYCHWEAAEPFAYHYGLLCAETSVDTQAD
jgi:hypothetical protein